MLAPFRMQFFEFLNKSSTLLSPCEKQEVTSFYSLTSAQQPLAIFFPFGGGEIVCFWTENGELTTEMSNSEAFCMIRVSTILIYAKDSRLVYEPEGPELKGQHTTKEIIARII